MADETELRRLLHERAATAPEPQLDASRLVRRTRARRVPRQVAVGGVLSLAIVGLGVGTVTGVRLLNPPAEMSAADGGSQESAEGEGPATTSGEGETDDAGSGAAGGGISLAPAYKVNLCEAMLGEPSDPARVGLSITVDFPEEAALGEMVRGSVEVTNIGDEPIRGSISDAAATTLSDDNVVLWHTPRVETTAPVRLAPGESAIIDAAFEPRVCSVEHDLLEDFPADLPHVEAGTYRVSVALDIVQDDGLVLQVVSAPTPITLD